MNRTFTTWIGLPLGIGLPSTWMENSATRKGHSLTLQKHLLPWIGLAPQISLHEWNGLNVNDVNGSSTDVSSPSSKVDRTTIDVVMSFTVVNRTPTNVDEMERSFIDTDMTFSHENGTSYRCVLGQSLYRKSQIGLSPTWIRSPRSGWDITVITK